MGCLQSTPAEKASSYALAAQPAASAVADNVPTAPAGTTKQQTPSHTSPTHDDACKMESKETENPSTSNRQPAQPPLQPPRPSPGLSPSIPPPAQHSSRGPSFELRAALHGGAEDHIHSSHAMLQKALDIGLSDAVVLTQAAGLKHIGYGPLKKVNQDEFFVKVGGFAGQATGSCYCIFDGHGSYGADVSAYCLRELPAALDRDLLKYHDEEFGSAPRFGSNSVPEEVKSIIKQAFVATERGLRQSGLNISSSGTTASVVCQLGAQVWVASVGDSRVISMRRKGQEWQTQPLTLDHRPSRRSEKARVVAAGGRVEPKRLPTGRTVGEPRLWLQDIPTPGLLLSRSIGDDMASSIGCTAEPEVTFMRLQPDVDLYLVMASDGVWDVFSNDQVCELVADGGGPEEACQKVLDAALLEWEDRVAADNISIVVVRFVWPGAASHLLIGNRDAEVEQALDQASDLP